MFFDDYPRFLLTSTTANDPRRLGIRYRGMFETNAHIFPGAKVLDIASHDGRWSFAASKLGAASVTGIEVRSEMVKHAEDNFAEYGVPHEAYRFINDDVFDVLKDREGNNLDVDVVLCLGFIYHTLRYQDLFAGVRALNPRYFLIDSAVILADRPFVRVKLEDTTKEAAGADHTFGAEGNMVTGQPSSSALELMLNAHGFTVVNKFDWPAFIDEHFPDEESVQSYYSGRRLTWLCEPSVESRLTDS